MAIIKGFKAIRPKSEYAEIIASLPYDVFSDDEAKKIVKENPLSFLAVDLPASVIAEDADPYSDAAYFKIKDIYDDFRNNYFLQEDEDSLYIYQISTGNITQTGLVCLAAVDDYLNEVIKTHEKTRIVKENDRTRHIKTLQAHTGPIFLVYRDDDTIENIMAKNMSSLPVYSFEKKDKSIHKVWKITDKVDIEKIINQFKNVPNLYVADGHHRSAAAVRYALERRKENPSYNKNEEFNYFLSILYPMSKVNIMDYNRIVQDLNGLTDKQFLKKIEKYFTVEEKEKQVRPQEKATFGLFLSNKWYLLTLEDKTFDKNDPVASLDVSILQKLILEPVLGIEDIRNDKRIDFVGGVRGLGELEKRVSEDMKLAFSMCPTSIEEMISVADRDKTMPPKSTWFEPKPLSGLFIHEF